MTHFIHKIIIHLLSPIKMPFISQNVSWKYGWTIEASLAEKLFIWRVSSEIRHKFKPPGVLAQEVEAGNRAEEADFITQDSLCAGEKENADHWVGKIFSDQSMLVPSRDNERK